MGKIMDLAHLEDIRTFFYLAVNKLITVKMQKFISLIAEYSGFMKNALNKLDEII